MIELHMYLKKINSTSKILCIGLFYFSSGCSISQGSKPTLTILEAEPATTECTEAINSDVLRDCITQAEIQLEQKNPKKALQLLNGLSEKETEFTNPNIYNLSDIEYINGLAHSHLNNHEVSLEHFERALKWLRSASDEYYTPNKERAYIHYEIGYSLSYLSKEEDAIEAFEKAIELHSRADEIDENAIGFSYRSLAQSLQRAGFLKESNDALREAILIFKRQSTETAVEVLNELGSSLLINLQLDLALKRFNEAVDLNVQSKINPESLAYSHYGLGSTFVNLGDIDNAEHHFGKSLQIVKTHKLEGSHLHTVLLNDWAAALIGINRDLEAVELLKNAEKNKQSNSKPENAANNAYIKGLFHAENGNYAAAESWYEKALSYSEILNRELIANVLNAYAATMEAQQFFNKANMYYHRALHVFQEKHGAETLHSVPTYYGLALLWQAQRNNTLATSYSAEAVNIIQEARSNLDELDSQLQDNFRDYYADIFQLQVDLLVDQGRIGDAERVLEMFKDTEQTLSLTRAAIASGARLPEDPDAVATGEAISAYFADARRYAELARIDLDDQLNEKQQNELKALETHHRGEDLDAQMAQVKALADKLNESRRLLVRNSGSESKTARQLKRMRDEDGENAAVLYLVANDKRFIHLLVTADGPLVQYSDIDPAELNEHIVGLRQALRPDLSALKEFKGDEALAARNRFWKASLAQFQEHSQWLYNKVLGPIEPAITASGAESLVLYVDGPLRYIPLAALHDGKRYLIERFVLARLVGPVEEALKDVDNVFERPAAAFGTDQNGQTVKASELYFQPLSSIDNELDLVTGDVGRTYFNERFSLSKFLGESKQGDHSVIHIATHYAQRPGPMENSFWIFGAPEYNRQVGAETLLSEWEPNNVEMLTLSACSTALPSLIDRGETDDPERQGFLSREIIGAANTGAEAESFAGRALRPEEDGGKEIDTVVATVWDVNDASTAVFMRRFYLHLANPDYNRAQALRQAQLDLLNNQLFEDEKERSLFDWLLKNEEQDNTTDLVNFDNTQAAYGFSDYSHPYFWAPFIMMGKWR